MRQSFHLIVVILTVVILAASGVAHAGEKKVFVGGVWYNQQRDGSLTVCQECNAGRPVTIAAEVIHPPDCPTSYPCQMMKPQFVTLRDENSLFSGENSPKCFQGSNFAARPFSACQSASGGWSGDSGVPSPRRPLRSLFGRLFAGFSLCGG